ncbi:hypothetical protein GXW76_16695, partial [Roseomonas soli]|nr:hypothetical protein [Neoroseomonas soli]
MTRALRTGWMLLAVLGIGGPAFGQSSLGGAGSLPPPQRPGSATAPAAPTTP